MLTCLIQPTSGHASVGGYDVQENPNEVIIWLRNGFLSKLVYIKI